MGDRLINKTRGRCVRMLGRLLSTDRQTVMNFEKGLRGVVRLDALLPHFFGQTGFV